MREWRVLLRRLASSARLKSGKRLLSCRGRGEGRILASERGILSSRLISGKILYGALGLEALCLRLIGGAQQAAAIRAGIVNKLPLIILVLLVEDADGLVFAEAGHSHDGSTTENLIAGALGSGLTERVWGAWIGCTLAAHIRGSF